MWPAVTDPTLGPVPVERPARGPQPVQPLRPRQLIAVCLLFLWRKLRHFSVWVGPYGVAQPRLAAQSKAPLRSPAVR